jgi:hypothetical protein
MKKAAYVLAAVLLMSLFSCASRPVIRDDDEGEGELVQALYRYNQSVYALEGEGVGIYKDPLDTLGFRAQVAAFWPALNVRLSVQDLVFKKPLVTLVKVENTVRAAVHVKRELVEVEYEEADFTRLTGFDIPGRLILYTLMGKVYVPDTKSVSQYEPLLLALSGDTGIVTIRFNEELRPVEIEYIVGERTFTVFFKKYVNRSGLSFPTRITLEDQGEDMLLEVTYDSLSLNQARIGDLELPEEVYEGYRVVQ